MILPNLYPSNSPLEFRAQFDTKTLNLSIAFHDPTTGCQTDWFDLRAKSSAQAFRWLHLGLNAAFENWPSDFLAGSTVRGHVGGDEAHQGILLIGEETILTEGIWSPWFTGRAAPYGTRPYPIELLSNKAEKPACKSEIGKLIALIVEGNLFQSESSELRHLLIAEYISDVDEAWAAGYLLEHVFSDSSKPLRNLDELRSIVLTLINPPEN